jgi:hypothetical protein
LQRGRPAEVGQVIVREHNVGSVLVLKRIQHLGDGFDASDLRREPMPPQMSLQQKGIVYVVFDEKNFQVALF